MRRILRSAALVSLVAVLGACYESPDPLGKVDSGRIDTRLSGGWRCMSPREALDAQATLWIIRFDDRQYYAEWREGDETTRYRAYSSLVNGETILNVEEVTLRVPSVGWIFVRYSIDTDGRLKLSLVSDDALGGLEGRAALRSIANRVKDEALYQEVAVCTREA